jgi:hypothetical protein
MRHCALGNLEIPGSHFVRPGMTGPHHINGVFAADIMVPAPLPAISRGIAKKRTALAEMRRCLPDFFA